MISYTPPYKHVLSMHPICTLNQHILSQHILSLPLLTTHPVNPPFTGVGPSMLNGRRGHSGNSNGSSSGSQSQSFHEALYYSDIKWQQNRAKRLENEITQRAQQQALEEERANTFAPVLSTSKEKQRAAVARRGVVPVRYITTSLLC